MNQMNPWCRSHTSWTDIAVVYANRRAYTNWRL